MVAVWAVATFIIGTIWGYDLPGCSYSCTVFDRYGPAAILAAPAGLFTLWLG